MSDPRPANIADRRSRLNHVEAGTKPRQRGLGALDFASRCCNLLEAHEQTELGAGKLCFGAMSGPIAQTGQSRRLITGRSQVRILVGPLYLRLEGNVLG